MTFGQRLKRARKEKGFTQKQLAASIKVKHNSVSNWEHDQNKPDLDTIRRICVALDVGLGYLLGEEQFCGAADKEGLTPAEARLLDVIRSLNESDREEVLEYACFKLGRKVGR